MSHDLIIKGDLPYGHQPTHLPAKFYALFGECNLCNFSLGNEAITVFAPINAAFQKIVGPLPDAESLVPYHLITTPKKIEQLGISYTSLNTRLSGGPPIWITISRGTYNDAFYVNNARILASQSNVIGIKTLNKGIPVMQVLHKIDEVLIPTKSTASSTNQVFNPNAWEFLENYESLIQGNHRVRNFRQKVQQYNRQNIFRAEGGQTFFIPVDEGFANNRASLIDEYIIDGHVIPKEVLFTTPTKKDSPFDTMANRDNVIRVVISFTQEQRDNSVINYVKSHTLFGDGKHPQGVVLAEIVKANIPVKNGVIHLIHKPLMIVDSTIKELLQEKDGGILNNFYNELADLGPEGASFLRTIEKSQEVTLFAPCNSALDSHIVRSIKRDKQKFLEILQMHVVVDNRLYIETVMKENEHKIYQVPTLVKGKNLYFNVHTEGNNRTMTVEGGGVNATVIQPDLAAKNGIIHIIDRVLGVPYTTILEKYSLDGQLRDSFEMGKMQQFNSQLNDTNKKFTYFVPSNRAWQNARVVMPSAIKKLFMPEFSYHAITTLQRHLVISDDVFTMERIKQMTKSREINQTNRTNIHEPPAVELPTLRGSLKIFVEERMDNSLKRNHGSAYIIHWEELRIPVFRPNVECTNGIIHVIDMPFLKKGDIRVSGSTHTTATILLPLLTFLLKFIFE
ncbi:unnamed protein product [Ceutorhynchus assimilis]|uniref:FAS1 domain-containing protein n=1 Tax=Ceutorhynchus assimilis TaxID=467358 RepID=A0A9N9MMV9_9CUCU|nr:unnamed protein product [Ceutorhynchus assimilis]